jgi:hypothetical protein
MLGGDAMLSPVAISGCAINLIIACVCLFVRYRRAGRDWLGLMAFAHGASALSYAILIPFRSGREIDAFLNGPGGIAAALGIVLAASAVVDGSARLRLGTHPGASCLSRRCRLASPS